MAPGPSTRNLPRRVNASATCRSRHSEEKPLSADKRKVATDALETLGFIITEHEKRDAIHLAVEPAVAACELKPGQHVGFVDGGMGPCAKNLGIVDPFLKAPVKKGQRFWFILYPREITALRHVWTHPAFPETPTIAEFYPDMGEAQSWIQDFAELLDISYEELMAAADQWFTSGDSTSLGDNMNYTDHGSEFPTFWEHYRTLTGRQIRDGSDTSFFRCAC